MLVVVCWYPMLGGLTKLGVVPLGGVAAGTFQ